MEMCPFSVTFLYQNIIDKKKGKLVITARLFKNFGNNVCCETC